MATTDVVSEGSFSTAGCRDRKGRIKASKVKSRIPPPTAGCVRLHTHCSVNKSGTVCTWKAWDRKVTDGGS